MIITPFLLEAPYLYRGLLAFAGLDRWGRGAARGNNAARRARNLADVVAINKAKHMSLGIAGVGRRK